MPQSRIGPRVARCVCRNHVLAPPPPIIISLRGVFSPGRMIAQAGAHGCAAGNRKNIFMVLRADAAEIALVDITVIARVTSMER